MFIDITGIDLFDQNVAIICANVSSQMFMDITDIEVFDQNVGMACANVRLRCSWISLALISLWVWHVKKLKLNIPGYE